MRLSAKVLIVLLAATSVVWAQASREPRKPGPEIRRELGYFVGNWELTGVTKPSPFGPGGRKFDASERLEWLPGGFFLMARSYEDDKWRGLTIIGYDENQKVFTHRSYSATGEVETMEGIVHNDTETWSGHRELNGKPIRQRFTVKKLSSTLYTFTFEMAQPNGRWSLVYEGRAVKTP